MRFIRSELDKSTATADIVILLIARFDIVSSTAYLWLKECRQTGVDQ